ncbi:DUF7239 family protein [Marinobacter salarius]|uniref:DUF7239 family protein n=1 Tax=Marinobacter salarius TaxID=1420917 RepID=UPI00241DD638|nr:hypothetical protein [Marinobacter salarius]
MSDYRPKICEAALMLKVKSDPHWATDEITALRQQLEQAEARCAELEQDAKNAASSIIRTVNSRRKATLIKQAEAIEAWLHGDAEMGGLDDYASRLRQQASELQNPGE